MTRLPATPVLSRLTKPTHALLLAVLLTGCQGALTRSMEQDLRERLRATHDDHTRSLTANKVEFARVPSDVEQQLKPDELERLDQISGFRSYQNQTFDAGKDLTGEKETPVVLLSLRAAIQKAVQNNLDVQFQQLGPAIRQTQVTQAEAVFDAVFFVTLEEQNLDTPRPSTTPLLTLFGSQQTHNTTLTTGIRKPLTTGGAITLQTALGQQFSDPSFFSTTQGPFSYHTGTTSLSIEQPLLRSFGSDVAQAEILLARSQLEQSGFDYRRVLLERMLETEQTYWQLVRARQRLQAQVRLLQRTVRDRDILKTRAAFDVSPVRLTEANSFVEQRRTEVIRARQDVRLQSDRLKLLMNARELPVSSEALIVPVDIPVDAPLQISLLDAVRTTLDERPEVRAALSQIKDAIIRQRVADNARLPLLNVGGTININGIDNSNLGEAWTNAYDLQFIDYIFNLRFEQTIGNRQAQAAYQQRLLERRAAVVNYQRTAQLAVVDVKDALRALLTSYDLIGATRASRRAAADNLRAIEKQEEAGEALSPEFLDLKLRRQDTLAQTEIAEIEALTDYNIAIAALYRAMGTLDQRNGIKVNDAATGQTGSQQPQGQ